MTEQTLPPKGEAPAILLIGAPGGGKTWSLTTLIEAGLELFVIGTEPRFTESLYESAAKRRLDISKIHSATIPPVAASFSSMIQSAELIGKLSFEGLAQIKSGMKSDEHHQFIKLLKTLANFTDEKTGESFGPVDQFGPERVVVVDSLSGINLMAKSLVVGAKPTASQGEWGVAMEAEENLINKLCSDLHCPFVLTAHVEREPNEITGGVTNQVGALGKKLAPKIPRFFSEVILCYRSADRYFWSTATDYYELKRRTLPLNDKIEPTFVPIVKAWHARLQAATPDKEV